MEDGGRLSSSSPSSDISEGSKKTQKTWAEVFHEHFPFYLNAGMTYDQFWNGDVYMVKDFRFAYQRKLEHENYMLWLQGAYIYNALNAVLPAFSLKSKSTKVEPYLKEPFPITQREVERSEENKAKEAFNKNLDYMKAFAFEFNDALAKKKAKEAEKKAKENAKPKATKRKKKGG